MAERLEQAAADRAGNIVTHKNYMSIAGPAPDDDFVWSKVDDPDVWPSGPAHHSDPKIEKMMNDSLAKIQAAKDRNAAKEAATPTPYGGSVPRKPDGFR